MIDCGLAPHAADGQIRAHFGGLHTKLGAEQLAPGRPTAADAIRWAALHNKAIAGACMPNRSPAIIILNGASSSGKTLAGQALMKLLGANCTLTGFDDILERVKPFGAEGGGSWSSFQRMLRIMTFQLRDGRLQLFRKLHREVVANYQAGHDVIVETSLMDKRALYDAALCFSTTNAFFVGMTPPLEVSEEWEAKRNDRPIGQARKHYDVVHAHGVYDLILDPSKMSPEECAATILDRLSAARPNAFQVILDEMPTKNAA